MKCKHCKDGIDGKVKCKTCKATLRDQCQCCHDELSHGLIPKVSIHFAGNSHKGLTLRQRSGLGKSG